MNKEELNLVIVSTGRYLPSNRITNHDLIARNPFFENGNIMGNPIILTDEWIIRRCGIKERRASDISVNEMAYLASKDALSNSGIEASQIERIIVATISAEERTPSVACKVGAALGINVCDPYDINAACAGFTKALNILYKQKSEFLTGYSLVIASERIVPLADPKNQDAMLFGDGAGAAILKLEKGNKGIKGIYDLSKSVENSNDTSCIDSIKHNLKLTMPGGKKVFNEATKEMENSIERVRINAGWDGVDLIIPHQANLRITRRVSEKLKERSIYEKTEVYSNIDKYGNMSAATIPIALDECLRNGLIKEGYRVVLTGFGAGLVCSATAIQF